MTDIMLDDTRKWMSALLDSADVDTIGASHWWDRASAALQAAAAGATTLAQATTIAAAKLQVDVLSESASRTVTALAEVIDPSYTEWADRVAAEHVYMVALVRVERTARRTSKNLQPALDAPAPY
ncbi:hypothetical protein [Bifidobacterium choerinum]|uniref:hypothetical protein n=1 Tax=Bifidobacterium choerinum TaxID=35760 RepID=UPI003F939C5E